MPRKWLFALSALIAGAGYLWRNNDPITPLGTPCDTNDLLLKTFDVGTVSIFADKDIGILKYSYEDAVVYRAHSESQGYLAYKLAIDWLDKQTRFWQCSTEQLLAQVKTLAYKITPNSIIQDQREYNYILTHTSVSFFHTNAINYSPLSELTPNEKQLLKRIHLKVKGLIKFYDIAIDESASNADFQDTIMIETIFRNNTLSGLNEEIPKKYQFNEQEKELIGKFYAIKPLHASEPRLIEGFKKALEFFETDPIKAAAYLHMTIVDIHPFGDGNGRTARLLVNDIFKRHHLPVIAFPNRRNYEEIIHQACKDKNYELFSEYLKTLVNGEGKEQHSKTICSMLYKSKCYDPKNVDSCHWLFNRHAEKMRANKSEEEKKHREEYRAAKEQRQRQVRAKNKTV